MRPRLPTAHLTSKIGAPASVRWLSDSDLVAELQRSGRAGGLVRASGEAIVVGAVVAASVISNDDDDGDGGY